MKGALTFLVWVAVLMVGTVTAAANFRYGWLIGHDEERYIYAIGGTVLDVVKTFLPLMLGTFLAGHLTTGTFFRTVVGWAFWVIGVCWSLTCALGLYSISKEASIGDTLGKQALYKQLKSDKETKQAQLEALKAPRTTEAIEGELAVLKRDRLWTWTRECTDATATASRTYCAKIDALTAEKATVRPAGEFMADRKLLETEIRAIETKLDGINLADVMKKADPATDALAKLLGWEPDTVKSRLALMIALLFEFTGLLPWIIHGSHGPNSSPKRHDQAEHQAQARAEPTLKPVQPVSAPAPAEVTSEALEAASGQKIDLPEHDSLVAQWAKSALVKRKGSFVPAKEMYLNFLAWCRVHGHPEPTQTAFGKLMRGIEIDARKQAGQQRYVDVALIPKVREFGVIEGGAAAV